MSKNGSIGVFDGAEQPGHGFFFAHLEVGVYGGDDQVEGRQDIIGIVQGSVIQDIGFDAFENGEGGEFAIELFDLRVLLENAIFFQAVGIECAFAVVADDEVFEAFFYAGGCHFFEGIGAVAPGAVAMDDGFDVGGLEDGGGGGGGGLFGDGGVFAGGRGDEGDGDGVEYGLF